MRIVLYPLFVLFICKGFAQSPQTLPLNEFYRLVSTYHPSVQRASMMKNRGEMQIMSARGGFDPKLKSEFSSKDFEGKHYYENWDTYLEVPTLLNVDLKAGFERNQGDYLNPENFVPSNGLYYAGVSIPLGQGLIRNERKLQISQSKLENQSLSNQATTVLNNLYLDANYAYWNWYEQQRRFALIDQGVSVARRQFEGIRSGVINGDNAAIDSVEMYIQYQDWQNLLGQTLLEKANSELLLSNFIWTDSIDLGLFEAVEPVVGEVPALDYFVEFALSNHPKLIELQVQGQLLEIDRQLSAESMKPVADVNYNVLLGDQQVAESGQYFTNNYKLGFEFEFPLLLRKERAKLRVVKLKLQENDMKAATTARDVINKIEQSHNKLLTLDGLVGQQQQIAANYRRMYEAEQIKFDNGESSIFLMNTRANRYLQSEVKLIELKTKYFQALGELYWSAGKTYQAELENVP